jgi:hypothetical protein
MKKRASQFLSQARKKMPVRVRARFQPFPPERQPALTTKIFDVIREDEDWEDVENDSDVQEVINNMQEHSEDQCAGVGEQGQDEREDVEEDDDVQEATADRLSVMNDTHKRDQLAGVGESGQAQEEGEEDWEDVEDDNDVQEATTDRLEDWEDDGEHGDDEQEEMDVDNYGDDEQEEMDVDNYGDDEQEELRVDNENDETGDPREEKEGDALGDHAKPSSVPSLLHSETYKTLKKYPVRPGYLTEHNIC